MASNPFLMETDYAQPAPAAAMYTAPTSMPMDTSASSNPFLSFGASEPAAATVPSSSMGYGGVDYYGGADAMGMGGGAGDNPFLNYAAPTSASASNPFADFMAPAPAAVTSASNDYYGMGVSYQDQYYQQPEPELQLIDTSEPEMSIPNTQNLLQSVTGALEMNSLSFRQGAPSPTPEIHSQSPSPPRTPSPDLLGGGDEEPPPCPPPPPVSANPLAPSPNPLESVVGVLDVFETSPPSKPAPQPQEVPKSSTIDLMGLYNAPKQTQPVSQPMESESDASKPPPLPASAPPTQPLVDLVIEPATPLIKDVPTQQEQPLPQEKRLSPDQAEKVMSPPEKPTPPRPPSPSCSPVHSPQHETAPPPARPTGPPVRPSAPPAAPSAPPAVSAAPPAAYVPPVAPPAAPKSPVQEAKPLPSRPPPPPPAARSPMPMAVEEPPPPASVPVAVAPAPSTNIFASSDVTTKSSPFGGPAAPPQTASTGAGIFGTPKPQTVVSMLKNTKATFDSFDEKFEKLADGPPTKGGFSEAFGAPTITTTSDSAWGGSSSGFEPGDADMGFGSGGFDSFLAMTEPPPVPQSTPAKMRKDGEEDDDEDKEMSITIRPRNESDLTLTIAPALAPPPKSPAMSTGSAFSEENTNAYVPFLSQSTQPTIDTTYAELRKQQVGIPRTDSAESPTTPLYEEDTSQPLEDFPRTNVNPEGWEMHVRYPNKKVTFGGQRSWRAVWVRIDQQADHPVVKVYGKKGDKEPIQEIPLQSSYSVSDIAAQQFDQYGKIFTVKLQFVYYKERPGVRPGQIGKASRLSSKLSAFATYAITGDPSGVKEFGSDLKKLGLPLEHAPQVSQLIKLGTTSFEDMKQFSMCIEEVLFRLPAHRDRALNYKTEEVQVTIVDEYYAEVDVMGVVRRQIARVRVMFLSFLNGVAEVEMGVNDLRRQGKEIVGRHDIVLVPTEEWIRMEDILLSNIVDVEEFDATQTIKFKPPDASYLELMRFRVRPPRHRELPLQVKTTFITTGQRIEIRSDILVPGYTSRKLGQIPCEDVMVRFPIPETWIYMFRVEKHFRYGSVKSAHRRSGKVKGVERILGALDVVEPSLMETTSGQAKYEHHHRAIVWRIPRLPKEGQGAYTTHSFFCHITLQPHEQIPDNLTKHCYVEFTMPHTTVSHTVCRSISVPTSDEPPEKCCRYLARHEYIVEIEHREGMAPASYSAAAAVSKEEEKPVAPVRGEFEENKYDSDFSDE